MSFGSLKRSILNAHKYLFFKYKNRSSSSFSYFSHFCYSYFCLLFLESLSLFSSFLQLFQFQVRTSLPIDYLPLPWVEKIIYRVTPTSLWETFHRSFLLMETHYIRALNLNEHIVLFSFSHPPDLVDAHSERRLTFYLKQIDYCNTRLNSGMEILNFQRKSSSESGISKTEYSEGYDRVFRK